MLEDFLGYMDLVAHHKLSLSEKVRVFSHFGGIREEGC